MFKNYVFILFLNPPFFFFFFFNHTATTDISPLPHHAPLPIGDQKRSANRHPLHTFCPAPSRRSFFGRFPVDPETCRPPQHRGPRGSQQFSSPPPCRARR